MCMWMDFINKFTKVTGSKPAVLRAIWSYLCSEVGSAENTAEEEVNERVASFLLESDDTDLIYDLRSKNGRPHDTSLDPFWSELQKYLDDVTAVHERRHSDML